MRALLVALLLTAGTAYGQVPADTTYADSVRVEGWTAAPVVTMWVWNEEGYKWQTPYLKRERLFKVLPAGVYYCRMVTPGGVKSEIFTINI